LAEETRFLLDASAIYPLICKLREKVVLLSEHIFILDLAMYEVGNVIWKEFKHGRIRNLDVAVKLFTEVLSLFKVLKISIEEFSEVEKIAVEKGITFYDASYSYVASRENLVLVTEDRELKMKHEGAISVEELLGKVGDKVKQE